MFQKFLRLLIEDRCTCILTDSIIPIRVHQTRAGGSVAGSLRATVLRGQGIFHCFLSGGICPTATVTHCFPFPRSPSFILISSVHLKIFDKNKNSPQTFKSSLPYKPLLSSLELREKGSSGLFQDIRSSPRVLFLHVEAASLLGVVGINHFVH